MGAMKERFKPEFLNRIDENIIFNSLSKNNLRGIVKLEVRRLEQRLKDRQITMNLSENALDYLTETGFDPVYGARPLKRAIQRELETAAAQGILKGDFTDGDTILVDADYNGLTIHKVIDGVVDIPVEESELKPEDEIPESGPELPTDSKSEYQGSFD